MAKRATVLFATFAACVAGLSLAIPGPACADTCPWGGDEAQSMRCFDCMKRVWTGERWELKNTCRPDYYGFVQPDPDNH